MPIYEYQCAACGEVQEQWQKFSDPPLSACPQCGGSMTKLVSNCAFHLKGSGWYVSEYSGSRPASGKSDETPATPAAEAGKVEKAADKAEAAQSSPIK